jgi:hypothetical protein
MGDWSDKLDYEYREYYGHLYDPDREEETEEETEEMTNVEILKEMAFTVTETQRRALEDAISALSENKGEWIKIKSGDKDFPESIVCSKCKNENSHLDFNEHGEPIGKVFVTSKFCPNCGAKMKGGEE